MACFGYWRFGSQGRIANALRELERFDEARALLSTLQIEQLNATVPEERHSEEAEERSGMYRYLAQLATVIERRDASSEPLDMVPIRIAAGMCLRKQAAVQRAPPGFCQTPEVREITDRQEPPDGRIE